MNINIGNKVIGPGNPTFIVAEMSANHNGSLESALQIVREAKNAGADAIKLQTYKPETITLNTNKDDFRIPPDSPWIGHGNLFSLYAEAFTPWEWHAPIFKLAKELGLEYFSSPFDEGAVDFLDSLGVSAYKIASPEITHIPLLEKVAKKGKPVILSSGIADLSDIVFAIDTLKRNGIKDIVLLKCTTSYPCPKQDCNLATISDMPGRFSVLSGLSDHTIGITASVLSVALGGSLIEKHIMLKGESSSVDGFFSAEPSQFLHMVNSVRDSELMLGTVSYSIADSAKSNYMSRRSFYVASEILAGQEITRENVKVVRPSFGLHPKYHQEIYGKKAIRNLSIGDRLTWDVLS